MQQIEMPFEPGEDELLELGARAKEIHERSKGHFRPDPPENESSAESTVLGVVAVPQTYGRVDEQRIPVAVRNYDLLASYGGNDLPSKNRGLRLKTAHLYAAKAFNSPLERELWHRVFVLERVVELLESELDQKEVRYVTLDHGLSLDEAAYKYLDGESGTGGSAHRFVQALKRLLVLMSERRIVVVGIEKRFHHGDLLAYLDDKLADHAAAPSSVFGSDYVFLNGFDPDEDPLLMERPTRSEGRLRYTPDLPRQVRPLEQPVFVGNQHIDWDEAWANNVRTGSVYVAYGGLRYHRFEFVASSTESALESSVSDFLAKHLSIETVLPAALVRAYKQIT